MKMRLLAFAAVTAAATIGTSTFLYAQSAAQVSSWSGVYSKAQADRGKALFEENCAKCHQTTLDGMDEIPALKGAHFMANWDKETVNGLMERIHNTMPLDNPGALDSPKATDVAAYLLSQNGMPAGDKDMTPGMLFSIRIDPVKPGG